MSACVQKGDFTTPNNVTGDPLNGRAYNGYFARFLHKPSHILNRFVRLIFNFAPDPQGDARNNADRFVAARATAVAAGVSGAIFRLASQQPGGLQATFDLPNGFLDLTTRVYVSALVSASMGPAELNHRNPSDSTSCYHCQVGVLPTG